jgi:hypothetical protein
LEAGQLFIDADKVYIKCADGFVSFKEISLPIGGKMSSKEFVRKVLKKK